MSDGAPRPGGLHHEQDGATAGAETVVLLHGGNLSGWMWAPQREALADRHLLVPDLPGYGGSRDLGLVSTTDAADRVAELMPASTSRGARARTSSATRWGPQSPPCSSHGIPRSSARR